MRNFFHKAIILSFSCLFFLGSCNSSKNIKTNEGSSKQQNIETINGSWILTNFYTDDLSIDLSKAAFIPTLEVDEGQMNLTGSDGCNKIHASLSKLDKEEIKINMISGTKMGCKMKNPYDSEYRNLLRTTRKYKVDSSSLTLYDGQSNKLLKFEKAKI